jgi:hypothetical protein
MKKQYHIKAITALLSVCVLLCADACTGKFEEYNTSPTAPAPDDMPDNTAQKAGILFSGMLYLMHNYQENDNQMVEQMVGNQYGGYMVTTSPWNEVNFGTLNPNIEWLDDTFDLLFTRFYSNYFKVKDITKEKGPVFAWANIIRVAVMLRVTDTYGPIPYTKMGGGAFAVEYDDVQTVYHAMMDDLNNAVAELKEATAEDGAEIAEFDIVYGGQYAKWIKFANSLKLRMAVRIAAVDLEYAKAAMQTALDPANGGCIESNNDNAFLPTTDNPYFKSAFSWTDLATNAVLSSYMVGYNDPRCEKYMTSVDGIYRGVRMGILAVEEGMHGSEVTYSKPNFTSNSPLLVYCAAETKFLKAEAALNGWISGNAKGLYEEGITTSMAQYNVSASGYTSSTAVPIAYVPASDDDITTLDNTTIYPVSVSWDDPQGSPLEKIITQKWLALYPLGMEAWCDFRRTGFPQLYPAQDDMSSESAIGIINNNPYNPARYESRLVRRLPYPESERAGNAANLAAAITMLGGPDKGNTDLWWAKKE